MEDEKKEPDLSKLLNGKEETKVNPELLTLFQRMKTQDFINLWDAPSTGAFINKKDIETAVDPELTALYNKIREFTKDHQVTMITPTIDQILIGGLPQGELQIFGKMSPGPYKSNILRSLYFRQIEKKIHLKTLIEKGEGTDVEIEKAKHELEELKKRIPKVVNYSISPGEDVFFISSMSDFDRGMSVGLRGFKNHDGSLNIDSYNLVMPDIHYPLETHQEASVQFMTGGQQMGKRSFLNQLAKDGFFDPQNVLVSTRRKSMYADAIMSVAMHAFITSKETHIKDEKDTWKTPKIFKSKKKQIQPSKFLLKMIGKIKESK